ncbi:sensor histidine kinase [Agrococcus citreus]|uniref:Histidine kinase domain-containing protein n=1 Tax=Agrococcus citreus TaxID=84643 RepID=A0ABP4JK96_9MICO
MRSAVLRFLLMGLAALIIVVTPVTFWILGQAERHALDNARSSTQRIADLAIGPLVTDRFLAGDRAAIQGLDARLGPWLDDVPVLRIRIWDADGRVVYSDAAELIGQQLPLPDRARDLFAGGAGSATIESERDLEDAFGAGAGQLVEVTVRAQSASGVPLVVEAHYDEADVRAEQALVLGDMAPALLLALAVLQLAQLVPAVRLARRIQADQAARRELLQRLVDVSDVERRRIARDLHDDVMQDLSGLSYALEAEEVRATPLQGPLLEHAVSILQDSVRRLRAMTIELYPPSLERLGMPAALERLAEPLRAGGIDVSVDAAHGDDPEREAAATLYRVAREALSNISKHAAARAVEVSLRDDGGSAVLTIRDDGLGFDADGDPPIGHLGLQIMRDAIESVGGTLDVMSRPGAGTLVEARVASTGRGVL